MKTTYLKLGLMILVLVAMVIYCNKQKSKVKYVNETCPVCFCDEILDFGQNEYGQRCHCCDCGCEFTKNN